MDNWLQTLYGYLDKRAMPETVASVLSSRIGAYDRDELVTLNRAAKTHAPWRISSMSDDFERFPDCSRALAAVHAVWGLETGADPGDAAAMLQVVRELGQQLDWAPGFDWKTNRHNRKRRAELSRFEPMLADLPKRQYNRRIRVLRNLEAHATALERNQTRRRLILISRSGFACDITADEFAANPEEAAFISYWQAQKNKRRRFTLSSRHNPMDEIANMLLSRLDDNSNWEMVAKVYSAPEVLAKLTDEQRGKLLAQWWGIMRDTATQLHQIWDTLGDVNRETMIVRRGMNSSSWNEFAGAYNAARSAWIGCLTASGLTGILDSICPGKVMRLMAADLAYWHASSGGKVDPNTAIWAQLALPWEVIAGTSACTRAHIEAACEEHDLNAASTGWTAPRTASNVVAFAATPELVHGVEIADPAWAALLRSTGTFSGKSLRSSAPEIPDGMIVSDLPGRR